MRVCTKTDVRARHLSTPSVDASASPTSRDVGGPWDRTVALRNSPTAHDHMRRTYAARHSGDGSDPSSVQYSRPSTIFPARTTPERHHAMDPHRFVRNLHLGDNDIAARQEPQYLDRPAFRTLRVDAHEVSAALDPLAADRPLHHHVLGEQITEPRPVPGLHAVPEFLNDLQRFRGRILAGRRRRSCSAARRGVRVRVRVTRHPSPVTTSVTNRPPIRNGEPRRGRRSGGGQRRGHEQGDRARRPRGNVRKKLCAAMSRSRGRLRPRSESGHNGSHEHRGESRWPSTCCSSTTAAPRLR